MKKITFPEIKALPLNDQQREEYEGDSDELATLKVTLKGAVNNPGREGITPVEMKNRIEIIDAIEDMGEDRVIYLDNGPREKLKQLFEAAPFLRVDRDILNILDAIKKAENHNPNDKGKKKGKDEAANDGDEKSYAA